ncbi:HEAT repeat domain-containing protein [Rhodopirellula sp. JC740]|uniref:HEAT repeat domain-containing protein n=1 Tax=Rhodopirellula halodulae TaxID=2894198 RepID=A0ABS8NJ00_9BACT|nr:HEAT repeat domain-containing protein [Rhodopirellula sp. JC740]MCC9643538.1 HEAT repeat domain-containing protein [Rhodopirellula sp. JC740]
MAANSKASAYTPDDPVVIDMVDRGIAYLEGVKPSSAGSNFMGGLGEQMLIAYTHLKVKYNPEAPVVKQGLHASRLLLGQLKRIDELPHQHTKAIYEIAVAIMFLSDLDKDKYKDDLKYLNSVLLREQYPFGAFGYAHETVGDISQTQYATLAFWTLDHSGIPLNYQRVEGLVRYLLRTQDVNGGWPYKATDPGPNRGRIQQPGGINGVTAAMTLAGGSSILIAGDAMRLWGEKDAGAVTGLVGLPKAIKLYKEDENAERRKKVTLNKDAIFRSIADIDKYAARNPLGKQPPGKHYFHYQLYTQERYESFLEIAKGQPIEKSPGWYNQGVEQLRLRQAEDGAFSKEVSGTSYLQAPVNTCLSVLFLIRSTQRSIASASKGSLGGGQGLPKDTTKIQVDGTQIKGETAAMEITGLLSVLEEDGNDALEGKSLPDNFELATEPAERRAQLDRFQRLLRGSQSWQARRVAARVLGKSDEMKVVPTLIFALSDPDTSVRRFARDGLRFISRKFEGFDMPDKPTDNEVRKAQSQWRNWYLTMDPGHVFLGE